MKTEYRNGIAGKVCTNPACGQWKPLTDFHPQKTQGQSPGYKSRCKACLNLQKRTKRKLDPEPDREKARRYVTSRKAHIQALKRQHQQENPASYADALRRYREKHRGRINQESRERRQTNIDHYREIGRKAYARHQEERKAYSRAYSRLNRDKAIAAQLRRRARKLGAEGSHTIEEWRALKDSYAFTCLCCGRSEPEISLTRDHIVPLERGGSNWIGNLQPLCASCNSKKGTKTIDYRPQSKPPDR